MNRISAKPDTEQIRPREYLLIALVAFLSATALPVYILTVQPDEFTPFDAPTFFAISLSLTATLALLGSCLLIALVWFGAGQVARYFFRFLLFWVALAGTLFPAVGGTDLVNQAKLDENVANLLFVFLGAALLAVLSLSSRTKSIAYVFTGLLLVTTFAPAVPSAYRFFAVPNPNKVNASKIFALSNQANLLVISLDGLSGPIANDVVSNDSRLRRAFSDFLIFQNAVSLAPSTVESMLGELYGNRDFRQLSTQQSDLFKKLNRSELLFNRGEAGGTAFTFGFYNKFNLNPATSFDAGDFSGFSRAGILVDAVMFFEYTFSRLVTARPLRLLRKVGVTHAALELVASKYEGDLALRFFNHKGPLWDLKYTKEVRDYEAFVDNIRANGPSSYVAYLHFSHTHFPVDLDSECRYRGDDQNWLAGAQNRQGLRGETLCALRQTARLIEKLKQLGVYDNTLLIVKSDHGQPASFFADAPENFVVNGHPMWGYDRYRPMLMIKNRSQQLQGPVTLPDLVTLGDLARTICLHWSQGGKQCAEYAGIDLLGARTPSESSDVYLNVVKDATSDYRFDTHKTVRFQRSATQQNFLELFERTPGVSLSVLGQRVTQQAAD